MRVLHLSNDHYPHVTGGTELFIHQLIQAQQGLTPRPRIFWAAHQPATDAYREQPTSSQPTELRLLPPVQSGTRLQQIASCAAAIPGFKQLLRELRPDVVHMHSFSERCGLSHAHAIKAAGARLLLTVHAPSFSCIKGNLIDGSGSICDGVLRARRCTRCRLHNGGLPRWLAGIVALQQGWPIDAETQGALAHVLTARQLTAAFQQAWLELTKLSDAIHVLADWSRDVLLRQRIPDRKIHLIRTAGPPVLPARARRPMQDGVLRLVFWGRCHPVKGLHLLVEAIQSLPADAPIQLDFYGPAWDCPYGLQLLQRIQADQRFRVRGNLLQSDLLPRLQHYDLAVVPSTWLETGPLTVLEAFAAGLPVAGSDLGGIRELAQGVPGCALLALDWRAWRKHLNRLINEPTLLTMPPPMPNRSFEQLAADLTRIYSSGKP